VRLDSAIAASLIRQGHTRMFGVMGDANMRIIVDYLKGGGGYTATTTEGAAVSMADGYSRVTGELGLATVTHGPGITNTVTALTEGVRHRSRVLLLTGDAPGDPGHLQHLNIAALAASVGAGYERIRRAETLSEDVARCINRISIENRPVLLDAPADLLADEIDAIGDLPLIPALGRSRPDLNSLDVALGMMTTVKRPLILAGRGAVDSDAHQSLIQLANHLGAPISTTLLAKSYFEGETNAIGIFGTLATDEGMEVIGAADCIVAFGAGLNPYTTGRGALLADKLLIQCDTDAGRFAEVGRASCVVRGDARAVAEQMVQMLCDAAIPVKKPWARTIPSPFLDSEETVPPKGEPTLRSAMVRLDRYLPRRRSVVTDAGRFAVTTWKTISVEHPSYFFHSISFGSIGLGLPTAIGVATGRPDQPTVVVTGDGGLMMGIAELSTAVRERLPLVVIVANDHSYGAEYGKLLDMGQDPSYSLTSWPDFAPIARSLGADGITVTSNEQLDQLETRLKVIDSPLLIDVKIDPTAQFDSH
jgi:acetolactate synthase-1/2/3 large subunit